MFLRNCGPSGAGKQWSSGSIRGALRVEARRWHIFLGAIQKDSWRRTCYVIWALKGRLEVWKGVQERGTGGDVPGGKSSWQRHRDAKARTCWESRKSPYMESTLCSQVTKSKVFIFNPQAMGMRCHWRHCGLWVWSSFRFSANEKRSEVIWWGEKNT